MLSSPRLAVNHPRAQPCQPAWLRWAEGCPGQELGSNGFIIRIVASRRGAGGLRPPGNEGNISGSACWRAQRGPGCAASCEMPLGSSWILLAPAGFGRAGCGQRGWRVGRRAPMGFVPALPSLWLRKAPPRWTGAAVIRRNSRVFPAAWLLAPSWMCVSV